MARKEGYLSDVKRFECPRWACTTNSGAFGNKLPGLQQRTVDKLGADFLRAFLWQQLHPA
jgi:hypothetical protein